VCITVDIPAKSTACGRLHRDKNYMEAKDMRDIMNEIEIKTAFKMGYVHNFYREPAFRAIEQQFGIKRPEILVLIFLGFEDGVTAAEIVEFSGHLKTNITRAVVALEKKGLLKRRTDASDQRRQILLITGEGRRIRAEFMPMLREREAWMLSALSRRECEQFEVLLNKLARHTPNWTGRPQRLVSKRTSERRTESTAG
jgi:MarR family transcriptional regulator, temperature-dependent positive regulator of motility